MARIADQPAETDADRLRHAQIEIGNVKAENAMLRQMVIELEAKLAMAGAEGERDERI